MTFRVGLFIDANAANAKKGLKETGTAVDAVKRDVRELGNAADATEADLRGLSAAESAAAANARNMGTANRLAAGSLGNLTAQFNDIGVMLAAGQNPLQLALQQGTQITQVLGPQGARGAVRALGSAFLSLLSPLNLITIGSIAAGAALIQWLTSGSEEAMSFADRMDELAEAVDAYARNAQLARADTAELEEKFGSAGEAVKGFAAALADESRTQAIERLRAALADLTDDVGGLSRSKIDLGGMFGDGQFVKEIDRTFQDIRREFDLTKREAAAVVLALEGLQNADGPRQVTEAASELNRVLEEVFGTAEQMPGVFRDIRAAAAEVGLEVGKITGVDETPMRLYLAALDQQKQKLIEIGQINLANLQEWYSAKSQEISQAQSMLATLQQESELRRLVLLYGEDSVQVADARAAAERDVYAALLDLLGIIGQTRADLLANYDNIVAAEAATNAWAGAMAGVAAQVQGILSALASIGGGVIANASRQIEIDALRAGKSVADARMAAATAQIEMEYRARDAGAANWFERAALWVDKEVELTGVKQARILTEERAAAAKRDALRNRAGGGGGGGRRSSTDRERRALERLIAREREQLDLIRTTDPVQKEMIRNREALKGAIDDERQAVEDLIATRIEEQEAMRALDAAQDFYGQTALDALDGLIFRGQTLAETWEQVAVAIGRAALQALLLGTGPLGGGGGGIFGAIFGAVGGLAGGGPVYGPGSGTSDDVLLWGSSGEFMMNAQATEKNRHLLELMNAGLDISAMVPELAMGGLLAFPARPANADAPPGRARDGRGAGGDTHNYFDIKTQDVKSFERGRASAARGGQRALSMARRYN